MSNYQNTCKGDEGRDSVMTFTVGASALRNICITGLLTLLLISTQVIAKRSGRTATIEGTAPTSSGKLLMKNPDGTLLVDGEVMNRTWMLKEFGLSSDSRELVVYDPDGDCKVQLQPCTATIAINGATLDWQVNDVTLTAAQRATLLTASLSGQIITLNASASVTATSSTGAPRSGVPQVISSQYTVKVPDNPVVQSANYNFNMKSGFPKTGFTNATFYFWMNGLNTSRNNNYTFSSDQPWVTVDSDGTVTFIDEPTAATKTVNITITNTQQPSFIPTRVYSFTVNKWFKRNSSFISSVGGNAALNKTCETNMGSGYTLPYLSAFTSSTNSTIAPRASDGTFWGDWGTGSGANLNNSRAIWVVNEPWMTAYQGSYGPVYLYSSGYVAGSGGGKGNAFSLVCVKDI